MKWNDTCRTASTVCPRGSPLNGLRIFINFILSPRTSDEKQEVTGRWAASVTADSMLMLDGCSNRGSWPIISLQYLIHLAKSKNPKLQPPKHLPITNLLKMHGFCGSNMSNPITKPTSMNRIQGFCGAEPVSVLHPYSIILLWAVPAKVQTWRVRLLRNCLIYLVYSIALIPVFFGLGSKFWLGLGSEGEVFSDIELFIWFQEFV